MQDAIFEGLGQGYHTAAGEHWAQALRLRRQGKLAQAERHATYAQENLAIARRLTGQTEADDRGQHTSQKV